MSNLVIDLKESFNEIFDSINKPVLIIDSKNLISNLNKVSFEELHISEGDKFDEVFDVDFTSNKALMKHNNLIEFNVKRIKLSNEKTLLILDRAEDDLNLLKQIFYRVPIGIVVFNNKGQVIFYNQAFEKMWGLKKEYLVDYNIFEDERLNSTGVLKQIEEVFNGRPFLFLEGYYDILLEKGKGYHIWVESTLFPIFDDKKEVEYVVIAHKDISDVKLAQEEIKIAKAEAEESNRLKNAFLQNLSHEIRTPLNAIIGFGDLMTDLIKDKIEQTEHEMLMNFNTGIKRLYRTLTQILELSQVDTGNYDLLIEPVNLKEMIENVLDDLKHDIEQKKLEVIIKLDEKKLFVLADKPALRRILMNLIENAVKFTQKGYIKIETYPNSNETILFCSIKDTGIGISENYLDHIFEPFSQEEDGFNRSFEGNGLGLALTKKYLDLINSSITVDSVKGVGSTFTFTLPIYRE